MSARYVGHDDPEAVLFAWGGETSTMDMGAWTTDDPEALLAAVQAESVRGAGEALEYVTITDRRGVVVLRVRP